MRAAGAAILGAAAVGALMLATRESHASPDNEVDFDVDAELALASNYYGYALARPEMWTPGQLVSLEGFLIELGMVAEATTIADMRIGIYGEADAAPEPLPEITYIPPNVLDEIADRIEAEAEAAGNG